MHAFLGAILFVGGLLKLYVFAVTGQEDDFATIFFAALSELEVFAGIWLMSGCRSEDTRPWVVVIFAGLWGSSLYHALAGDCSCGCFGLVAVNPWLVLIFDLIVVIVLLKWHSNSEKVDEGSVGSLKAFCMVLATMAIVVAGVKQQSLVTVSGTAFLQGRPLGDASLTFRRYSLALNVRTDKNGCFRLPPIRPGRYSISMATAPVPGNSSPNTSGHVTRKGSERPPQSSHWKGSKKTSQHSETMDPSADVEFLSLDVNECPAENLRIEFKI